MKTLAILLAICSPAVAGHCRQNVVVHQQYVAPVVALQVVQPYAYWSVGAQIQEEAVAERIARLVTKKLELRMPQAAAPVAEKPLGLSVLQNQCAKCHKPDSKAVVEGKGPALFDALGNLTASQEQVVAIGVAVRMGVMPPAPADTISDDDYLAIKSYLKLGDK